MRVYWCAGVLVANKSDLSGRREVEEAEGRSLAESKDLVYFETSAVSATPPPWPHPSLTRPLPLQKEHDGVEKPFQFLAEQFYHLYQESQGSFTAHS